VVKLITVNNEGYLRHNLNTDLPAAYLRMEKFRKQYEDEIAGFCIVDADGRIEHIEAFNSAYETIMRKHVESFNTGAAVA
jgi:hypothetical protein